MRRQWGFHAAERADQAWPPRLQARLEGTPQLGAGPVFPLALLPTVVKNFDMESIPTYARYIIGIDFGYSHPFAAVAGAWAHDTGQVGFLFRTSLRHRRHSRCAEDLMASLRTLALGAAAQRLCRGWPLMG
jgi:hypothetical protein